MLRASGSTAWESESRPPAWTLKAVPATTAQRNPTKSLVDRHFGHPSTQERPRTLARREVSPVVAQAGDKVTILVGNHRSLSDGEVDLCGWNKSADGTRAQSNALVVLEMVKRSATARSGRAKSVRCKHVANSTAPQTVVLPTDEIR